MQITRVRYYCRLHTTAIEKIGLTQTDEQILHAMKRDGTFRMPLRIASDSVLLSKLSSGLSRLEGDKIIERVNYRGLRSDYALTTFGNWFYLRRGQESLST